MAYAIVGEHLSKQYRLGQLRRNVMFREVLVQLVKCPFGVKRQKNDNVWALRDVSFHVEAGEVVGIIGRNGSGKSTLLKVLSKITYPTSGVMKAYGRVASLLEVGTGFHSELTGRENIYLNGSILGMGKKEIQAKLDGIVSFAGVEKFLDTPVKYYSSGMGLRLGFAVAAHLEPDVLLVDEVLAVGDTEFQKKCLGAMRHIGGGGRTVLFVSHNMAAIENLCSRAIWIDNGQIRQDGEARAVIQAYLSMFTGAQRTSHDLRRIESRDGLGAVQYTGIEFLGTDKQPETFVRSGDGLIVRLYYQAEERIPYPLFGFQLYTELGSMVTAINTWGTGLEILPLSPGNGWIDLEIDFLNLMPARYYVSLQLSSGGGSVRQDHLDHCATLDVEASDFYQSGKGINSRFGIIFLPGRWRLP
jgi:lipopolysaccharide transport system ATP-binding protein